MARLEAVDFDPFSTKANSAPVNNIDPLETALAAEGITGAKADIARSIYQQESSSGKNTKTSNAGAVGGMQIIPATFNRMADKGWSIDNPEQNARAGVRYISTLYDRAGGDPELTAAGYYGGEGAIKKAKNGVAVSDPRNPKAPNTLQYGKQVASRLPKSETKPVAKLEEVDFDPFAKVESNAKPLSRTDKVLKGVKDPVDAGAQLLTNILPDSVVEAGNSANNWLADKTGLVERLPEGGINQQITDQEAEYQARREAQGEEGLDGYRLTGNIVSPVNLAAATKIPKVAGFGKKLVTGAASGAALTTATQPVVGVTKEAGGKDFVGEKVDQATIGAIGGAAGQAVVSGVSRLVSPAASTNQALKTLKKAGVNPTIGQTLGGAANKIEEKLTSLPIMGDMISNARNKAGAQFERATYESALKPIGQTLPKGLSGRDALVHTENVLKQSYDKVLNKIGAIKPDQAFNKKVSDLEAMVNNYIMPKAEKAKFKLALADVKQSIDKNGVITAEAYKTLESSLGKDASRLFASQNVYDGRMAPAVKQLQAELRDMLGRQAGGAADELKSVNNAYSKFKIVQNAAAKVGAEGGEFTPAQYQNAVRVMDKSKDKAQFARGKANGQELGDAGKQVLSSKVADSGTAGRVALGAGAVASGAINPMIPLGLTAGASLYTPAAQKILNALVTKRPELAKPLAKALRENGNKVTPAFAASLSAMLND
jgi:hypothetical protein